MEQAVTPTPESQQAALKPCPFCGSEARETAPGFHNTQVACQANCCQAVSRKAWNTRTPAPVDHAALDWDTLICTGCGSVGASPWPIAAVSCCPERRPVALRTLVDAYHAALRAHPAGGVSADAEWLRHLGNDLYAKGHLDRHEAEEIGRVADRYLRAHPAGGVSDTQKTLQRGGLREIIQEALTAKFDDGREEYLLHHGIIRAGFTQPVNATKNYENRLIEALRAAGIGAGVVENDK